MQEQKQEPIKCGCGCNGYVPTAVIEVMKTLYSAFKQFSVKYGIPMLVPENVHGRPTAVVVSEIWDNSFRQATEEDANRKFGKKVLARSKKTGIWEETSWRDANNRVYYTHWMRLPDAEANKPLEYPE